jgi:hypothetical protein
LNGLQALTNLFDVLAGVSNDLTNLFDVLAGVSN